jgi:predicted nucleic acid-binding Zn ribbon protein/predicted RNA-binding Zn-ribbon protein involved in translation (DUF1610 family)
MTVTYCTICGKPATVGVYCDECAQKLEMRVNRGLVVTKGAVTTRNDYKQSSTDAAARRHVTSRQPGSRPSPVHGEKMPAKRTVLGGIAIGKDGLPVYCPECGNMLRRDGPTFKCKACNHEEPAT